jgi:hypothetical protein
MAVKGRWRKTAAGFLLLAVAMGVLQWNWFAMPLERDEGEYAYAAWLMRTGKGVPYRDSFLQKPPMIVYTYGLVEALAPKSDKAGFRVAGFLASLATAGLVWGLGKREFGGRAGMYGAWLWVVFLQQTTLFASAAANVEKFMAVPVLGAMAAAGGGERRWWRWGLAGALAGAAVLYKPICGPVLAVWFLWAVLAKPRQTTGASPRTPGAPESRTPQGRASAWRRLGWVVLGGVAAVAAGIGWFAWKGALGAMWECAVEYVWEYAKLPGHNEGLVAKAFETWKMGLIAVLTAAGLALRWRKGLALSCATAVASWVALTGVNGHYVLTALPFAAMMAGKAVEAVSRRFGRHVGMAGAAITAVLFLVLAGIGEERKALGYTPRGLSEALYRGNPFPEAEGAGRIVGGICRAGDTVHIVGSEPEILWHARRKGATRFDIAYPLALPTRHAADYQREALRQLADDLPEVVVLARTRLGFLGPPELYAGYLREMAGMIGGGGYRLAWSFVPGIGEWVSGGDWGEREKAGASLGIWVRNGKEE